MSSIFTRVLLVFVALLMSFATWLNLDHHAEAFTGQAQVLCGDYCAPACDAVEAVVAKIAPLLTNLSTLVFLQLIPTLSALYLAVIWTTTIRRKPPQLYYLHCQYIS